MIFTFWSFRGCLQDILYCSVSSVTWTSFYSRAGSPQSMISSLISIVSGAGLIDWILFPGRSVCLISLLKVLFQWSSCGVKRASNWFVFDTKWRLILPWYNFVALEVITKPKAVGFLKTAGTVGADIFAYLLTCVLMSAWWRKQLTPPHSKEK